MSYVGLHPAMRQLSSNQSVDQPVVCKPVMQSHVSNHSVGQRKKFEAVSHNTILSNSTGQQVVHHLLKLSVVL